MEKIDKALELCKSAHSNQKYQIDGKEIPYYNHCMIVADLVKDNAEPEMDKDYAQVVALLHDTIEDTSVTYDYLEENFGKKIADGVLAVTKDSTLPHEQRLDDSLSRIVSLGSREVAAVKLADRICNLHEIPAGWTKSKSETYLRDADKIYKTLGGASKNLSKLLQETMEIYKQKIQNFGQDKMRYLTLKDLLYAYDGDTGITVKYSEDKWNLADLSFAALVQDPSVQEITKSEAVKMCAGKDPKEFINEFISGAFSK